MFASMFNFGELKFKQVHVGIHTGFIDGLATFNPDPCLSQFPFEAERVGASSVCLYSQVNMRALLVDADVHHFDLLAIDGQISNSLML